MMNLREFYDWFTATQMGRDPGRVASNVKHKLEEELNAPSSASSQPQGLRPAPARTPRAPDPARDPE